MLQKENKMGILEAYDLTKSYRSAAQLTGVDHHTVTRLVVARTQGIELEEESIVRSKATDTLIAQ